MLTKEQNAWNKVALLSILDGAHKANESPADNFAIQKLTFLTEHYGMRQSLHTAYYKFFRFTWGPYSSEVANDVRQLEALRLIDSESRQLTSRGRFVLDYVCPEMEASKAATDTLSVISQTMKHWGWRRGWQIVNPVYDLVVPVDGRDGEEMKVSEIPINTDIFVPHLHQARETVPFSEETISDIESEFAMPANHLDPESPDLRARVAELLDAALTF